MSQIYIRGSGGGGGGGTGILTITGDVGGAVGADVSNNINLITGEGLTTSGAPISNTVTITLDNHLAATGQTIGAVTLNLVTLPLGIVPGTYTIDCSIAGFDATTPAGIGYTIVGAVRTTGAAATLLNSQAVDSFEEAATGTCTGTLVVDGANNLIIQVLGAAGQTINWKASVTYIFAS